MRFIRRLSKTLESIESFLAALSLLTMIFLASYQVLLRNVWDTGLIWGNAIVQSLVIWVGFLGASMATHERGHIRFDVLSKFLPERLRNLSLFVVHLGSSLVCALLTRASYLFIMGEKDFGTLIEDFLPAHWVYSILVFGFGIMAARFLMLGLEDLKNFFSPPKAEIIEDVSSEKGVAP